MQNLIIKLPRLHTRLAAVHSKLSLGPCRRIGGQHLLRGHNNILAWVKLHACLLNVWGTLGCLWNLTSDKSPALSPGGGALLTGKESIFQCWSEHFEGLFSDHWTYCAGVITGQEPPSGCKFWPWWPTPMWGDQESCYAPEGRKTTLHWWHSNRSLLVWGRTKLRLYVKKKKKLRLI